MHDFLTGLTGRDFEILNYIQKNGPVTKHNLLERMNLKLTTLNRSMNLLESKKLVVESGVSASTGGRRPVEYDVAASGIYTIGVDISRTYTEVVVMNLKLQVLQKNRFDMDETMSPQRCVAGIADTIKRMLAELFIDKEKIMGIGLGTVGPMNRESGRLLYPPGFPNAEWNDEVPIKDWVEGESGILCEIDNGANTAALVEFHFGIGREYNSIAYIHCGVGIRTAIIKDDLILRAMNDSEDAFAHMTVNFDGIPCRCGSEGCLESYASLESISQRYKALTGNQINYKELFSRAVGCDEVARETFNKGAKILGVGVSNLAKLLNPNLVILSGPLISNYDPYYSICVRTFYERNSLNNKLVFSREGVFQEDVVAIGAGLMVIEHKFKQAGRNE